eukprot:comp20336_c1_seq1/m.25616 comp20336_c1_seq1/g.25616  ORF comp20336_c1_seq1/g.25616 comp20336_c1_seq1/m.25616 type:complete len:515 (-) comp20336_c1_seq1:41-1585(-)
MRLIHLFVAALVLVGSVGAEDTEGEEGGWRHMQKKEEPDVQVAAESFCTDGNCDKDGDGGTPITLQDYGSISDLDRVLFLIGDTGAPSDQKRAVELWGGENAPSNVLFAQRLECGIRAWAYMGCSVELASIFKDHPDYDWLVWLPFFDASVRPSKLGEVLGDTSSSPSTDMVFLARGIHDNHHVIIHHYSGDFEMKFPDVTSGFALSRALVLGMGEALAENRKYEFNIDPAHELAKWLLQVGPLKVALTHTDTFCPHSPPNPEYCAIVGSSPPAYLQEPIENLLDPSQLLIAVKTHPGNANTRVPVIKRTWQKDHPNGTFYFSSESDPEIPTIVTEGVPNTEGGHCGKMQYIIDYFQKHYGDKAWLFIADDDTMLSVRRLRATLAHYDPTGNEPLVIGERYGYGHNIPTIHMGYHYPTLGGGAALSRGAVKAIVDSGRRCGSVDTPDDMYLGMTLTSERIPLVAHPGFHQEPPRTYTPAVLHRSPAISFHRFFGPMIPDPDAVYREFAMADPVH